MPDHSGIMVAFFLPKEMAEETALDIAGATKAADLHITLAYLGEIGEIENHDKLPAIVASWAEKEKPIKARLQGLGVFNNKQEDGTKPFYASVDSQEIQAFRQHLVDELEEHGYSPKNDYGYTPHVTLAYIAGPMPDDVGLPEDTVTLASVALCMDGQRHDYPLARQPVQEVIRKEDGKFYLYSRDGSKKLGGPYDTRYEAEERERQVQYFKHKDEVVQEQDLSGYSETARALLADMWARGMQPAQVTQENTELAWELEAEGLGYFDGQGAFNLTLKGARLAEYIQEAGGRPAMPNTLVSDRIQTETVSELWPVLESEDGLEGKAWDVTLIGAVQPGAVVRRGNQEYVRSQNGRLYSCEALENSVPMWNGVKVYDNHLTDQEFQARQGMRSVVKEWVGTVVKPYWDAKRRQLRGVFKVVDEGLARKLLEAHRHGILSTIGLSIDTLPTMSGSYHEGAPISVIDGFQKIFSVDLVAEPAAGGGFNRLIASVIDAGGNGVIDRTSAGIMQSEVETSNGGQLFEWIQHNPAQAKEVIKGILRERLGAQKQGDKPISGHKIKVDLSQLYGRLDQALREADYACNAFNTEVQQWQRTPSAEQHSAALGQVQQHVGQVAKGIEEALQAWNGAKRAVNGL
jgi:2'-5' RNA ligase